MDESLWRRSFVLIGIIALGFLWKDVSMAQVKADPPPRVIPVDVLERVFPDRAPTPARYTNPIAVPRGGSVAFQFVISSPKVGAAKLHLRTPRSEGAGALDAKTTVYEVLPVTVEANTRQAGAKVGEPAEERWLPFLIRQAPFQAAEVLAETDTIRLEPDVHSAVLCDIQVARSAQKGKYRGALIVEWEGERFTAPFSLEVYAAVVPETPLFASSHWFSASPDDLTGGPAPAPWSEGHWALIERMAEQLHTLGDTAVHTPLIAGQDPMIQTIRKYDGSYNFDFTRFDRWVRTFLKAGYTTIDGASIAGGHWICPEDICARAKAAEATVRIFRRGEGLKELGELRKKYEWPEYRDKFAESASYRKSVETYGHFLAQFFEKLYAHLQKNGWVTAYRQGLLDEPRTVRDYAYLSDLCRRHMPGVKIADAIHGWGVEDYEAFSPYVDMWIMEMQILRTSKSQQIIAERRRKGLQTGMYVLGKASAWPNRLLDRPLSDNRTQPWLMYLYQADYYIHWAANRYRGVKDPYEHSIGPTGPLSGGKTSTNSGHPPGNNWLFYPGPNGLLPTMRVIAFRDGALDYALLTMLAKRDKLAADAIVKNIVRTATDYETNPYAYHQARKSLLDALEK